MARQGGWERQEPQDQLVLLLVLAGGTAGEVGHLRSNSDVLGLGSDLSPHHPPLLRSGRNYIPWEEESSAAALHGDDHQLSSSSLSKVRVSRSKGDVVCEKRGING